MARLAHDLSRALDVNVNGTRMYNRVRGCIICTYAHVVSHVSGAAATMQRLCGAYAVAVGVMAHELVVACSTCARAL